MGFSSTENEVRRTTEGRDISARFWDRIAKRYSARPVPDQNAYAHKLKLTQSYLDSDARVLELGCGTGTTAIAHAPHVAAVTASDFSPQMIHIARQKAASAGLDNLRFVCAPAREQLASGERYEVVMAHSVLHLLPDWRETISAVRSNLRPGGLFITNTHCLMDAHGWLRWVAPIGRAAGFLPQMSFFSTTDLQAELTGAGFKTETRYQPDESGSVFLISRFSP